MFGHTFPACAFYLIICIFIDFEMEISSRILILLFMPGSVHSGSAS